MNCKAQCRVAHTGLKWTKTTNPNGVPQRINPKAFWKLFVEPRWGSIIGAIGDPACALRHWALEFNAVGVKARWWREKSAECRERRMEGGHSPCQRAVTHRQDVRHFNSSFLIPNS